MRLFLISVLLFTIASTLRAQSSTGSILGTVQDASGAAIPGATVVVTNTATNISRNVATVEDGSYRVDALNPGQYTVTVTKEGFGTETLTALTLEVTQQLRANATLRVGAITESVDVSDTVPQVDTTQSALGGLVDSQQVEDLPLNGRNFIDLALLQPGVANDTRNGPSFLTGTFFSSNGAPTRSNNVMLDGSPEMNLKGVTGNAVGTTLGIDGIQEFKILTNSFGAQYGISLGSQTVIASKAGTNQFHGDGYDYLRNNDLDARGYFATREPRLVRNDFGGAFGGPIKKDKMFALGVYEGIRQLQDIVTLISTFSSNCLPSGTGGAAVLGLAQGSNPCSTAPFTYNGQNYNGGSNCTVGVNCATQSGSVNPAMVPVLKLLPAPNSGTPAQPTYTYNQTNPESINFAQLRVDQQFSVKDSMFGRFTWDNSQLQVGNSFAGTAYQGVGSTTQGMDMFITASEDHVFSPSRLNTFRLNYSRTIQHILPVIPASLQGNGLNAIYNQPFGDVNITGGPALGAPGNLLQQYDQNLYSISDDFNLTKGKHALQLGTLFNRIEYYTNTGNASRGTTQFNSTASFLAGSYLSVNALAPGSNNKREPRFYTMGFYIQDDWRALSRVTLNLGLRYEPDTVPFAREQANWAFHNLTDATPTYGPIYRNVSRKNFSPRVGFNWDIFGKGKSSLHGAFGEYFDVNASGWTYLATGSGTPPLSAQITLASGTLTAPFPIITSTYNLVPGTMPYGSTNHTTAYLTDQPHLLAWNAGVSQQVTQQLALTAAYVGSRGIHLWDTEEGNPCFPSSTDSRGLPIYPNPYLLAPAGITTINNSTTKNAAGTLPNPLNSNAPASALCMEVTNPGTSSAAFVVGTYPNGTKYLVPNRLNPNWGDWVLNTTNADSYYNALQLVVTERPFHGLEGQVAYTYSVTTDDAQGVTTTSECIGSGGVPSQVLGIFRKKYDSGPACFDIRQEMEGSLIYHLPKTEIGGFIGRELLSGWWLSNKSSYEGGLPFNPVVNNWRTFDQNITSSNGGAGSTDNVSYGTVTVGPGAVGADGTVNTTTTTFVPYNRKAVITHNVNQWYNPAMFTMNPLGTLGTVTRNAAFRGPHFANFDVALNKDTPLPFIGDKGSLQFQLQAFNIFNHTNLSLPNGHEFAGALTDAGIYTENPTTTAGQITSITGNPRQIQISLKLLF